MPRRTDTCPRHHRTPVPDNGHPLKGGCPVRLSNPGYLKGESERKKRARDWVIANLLTGQPQGLLRRNVRASVYMTVARR